MTRAGYEQNEFGYLELLTAQRPIRHQSRIYLTAAGPVAHAIEFDGMLLSGGLDSLT